MARFLSCVRTRATSSARAKRGESEWPVFFGVDLPREKRVEIGLTYIYGIGRTTATKLCAETGVDPATRVKDLTEDEVTKLRDAIDGKYLVEGDLRRETSRTSSALWTSAATVACVTVRVCLSVVSAPTPTLVPARVPVVKSVRRRGAKLQWHPTRRLLRLA